MPEIDVEVTIETDVMLSTGIEPESASSLVEHVLRHENASGRWSLAIRFVSDPVMQQMHDTFMGLDAPTDIMTFPYDEGEWPVPETETAITSERGGDLVISVDRAAFNAAEAGWSTSDELHFLICHGLLHLLGWRDDHNSDRERMLARQHALLESWASGS